MLLLHKHALKSVAQRALADLTSSLHAEAVSPGCIGRLRLAAEMIGLGREEVPWSEAKAHFFFWMLALFSRPVTFGARWTNLTYT